jgi:hypothetical protein
MSEQPTDRTAGTEGSAKPETRDEQYGHLTLIIHGGCRLGPELGSGDLDLRF